MTNADAPGSVPISERAGPVRDYLLGRTPPSAPAGRLLDMTTVAADPERGTLTLAFSARPEFASARGNIVGGFLGAMFDTTMGFALIIALPAGETAVLAEMKLSFLRPAPVAPLVCAGRVLRRGRSIAFLEGDLRDEAGELIATASATAIIRARQAPPNKSTQ